MAVQNASLRTLKRRPEELSSSDRPALLEALRPLLGTFLGAARATAALAQLAATSDRS